MTKMFRVIAVMCFALLSAESEAARWVYGMGRMTCREANECAGGRVASCNVMTAAREAWITGVLSAISQERPVSATRVIDLVNIACRQNPQQTLDRAMRSVLSDLMGQ